MQYLDKENNPIEPERYSWVVFYDNDEKLVQFGSDRYHYFDEIDHSRAIAFGMISQDSTKRVFKMIPPGAKLIHYYDNLIQHPLGGTAIHHRLYCFGYEIDKEKHIWTILPKDIVIKGNINDIEVL